MDERPSEPEAPRRVVRATRVLDPAEQRARDGANRALVFAFMSFACVLLAPYALYLVVVEWREARRAGRPAPGSLWLAVGSLGAIVLAVLGATGLGVFAVWVQRNAPARVLVANSSDERLEVRVDGRWAVEIDPGTASTVPITPGEAEICGSYLPSGRDAGCRVEALAPRARVLWNPGALGSFVELTTHVTSDGIEDQVALPIERSEWIPLESFDGYLVDPPEEPPPGMPVFVARTLVWSHNDPVLVMIDNASADETLQLFVDGAPLGPPVPPASLQEIFVCEGEHELAVRTSSGEGRLERRETLLDHASYVLDPSGRTEYARCVEDPAGGAPIAERIAPATLHYAGDADMVLGALGPLAEWQRTGWYFAFDAADCAAPTAAIPD